MSGTANLRISLQIASGNLNYQSQPTAFSAAVNVVNAAKGPTPGAVAAPVAGVDVDLSKLTVPGYCWMQNLDATNSIEYGIRDTVSNVFYPLGELAPGEPVQFKFSRSFGTDQSPGTGSHVGTGTTKLHLRGIGGTCNVRVDAFEG